MHCFLSDMRDETAGILEKTTLADMVKDHKDSRSSSEKQNLAKKAQRKSSGCSRILGSA
jgi:DNA-binding IscR family transcriptional regulator